MNAWRGVQEVLGVVNGPEYQEMMRLVSAVKD